MIKCLNKILFNSCDTLNLNNRGGSCGLCTPVNCDCGHVYLKKKKNMENSAEKISMRSKILIRIGHKYGQFIIVHLR